MKKILLINPNSYANPPVPPIGLEYIASALEDNGYEVDFLDLFFSCSKENYDSKIKQSDYICITFRNLDTCCFLDSESFIEQLKIRVSYIKANSDAVVVLGGVGFSIAPEEILDYCGADYGIVGQGENALLYLLKNRNTVSQRILYGENFEGYRNTHQRKFVNYSKYIKLGSTLGVTTHFGCKEVCSYCVEGRKREMERSITNVMDEIKQLRQYGSNFMFCDSEFNSDIELRMELMQQLIEQKMDISYYAYLKPENISERFVEMLAKSGGYGVSIGLDTMHEEGKVILNKKYTTEQIEDCFQLLNQYQISFVPSFIVGFPWDTIEMIEEGVKFCEKNHAKMTSVNVGVRVYPNTEFCNYIMKDYKKNEDKFYGAKTNNAQLLKPLYYMNDRKLLNSVMELRRKYNISIPGC
ncbi:B12-binding domain-containing radical SAM protein [Clostridium sp. UBA1652]|uniref:B12-binding domain-containing radical SAM protein n=1 Tax=Clostridium sp. UBA1652 TaxID=1946348 RepID=UPI002579BFAC|nr:cobalamin-dependent protein [Clostridium sp. UBA1652]